MGTQGFTGLVISPQTLKCSHPVPELQPFSYCCSSPSPGSQENRPSSSPGYLGMLNADSGARAVGPRHSQGEFTPNLAS